jgi:hypothetical protein
VSVTALGPAEDQMSSLCDALVKVTGVTCCGVTMATLGGQGVTAHASDRRARAVEALQHTLGEGPGVAAAGTGAAVLVPDLCDSLDVAVERWPTFAKEAIEIGVQAAFAFPLVLGTSPIGALSLYRTEPGELSTEQTSRSWLTAEVVALTLADQAEQVSIENEHLDPMRVHQAAGMVMVQLGVPIDEALLRLRATAFAQGMTVDELADAVVQRRQRISKEDS